MVLREGGKECLMLRWARDIGREKFNTHCSMYLKKTTRNTRYITFCSEDLHNNIILCSKFADIMFVIIYYMYVNYHIHVDFDYTVMYISLLGMLYWRFSKIHTYISVYMLQALVASYLKCEHQQKRLNCSHVIFTHSVRYII